MNRTFLDTGFVIALEMSDDQHHERALAFWREWIREKPHLVTTSFVFDEIVTFFNSRGRHAKAVEIGQRLRHSRSLDVIHVDEALFELGWSYFQKRADKGYSLTDCISFVLMGQESIFEALSFDRHFEQAGFKNLPGFTS